MKKVDPHIVEGSRLTVELRKYHRRTRPRQLTIRVENRWKVMEERGLFKPGAPKLLKNDPWYASDDQC